MAEPSVLERLSANLSEDEEAPTTETADNSFEQEETAEVETKDAELAESEDASEEEDAIEVSSIGELAEHLGLEMADIYGLSIPVTDADGNKASTTLGEWKDAFQSSKIYAKQQAELRAERERFAQEQSAATQKIQRELETAAKFVQQAEKALLGDIERIDWNSLRVDDPAEFAAKRQEMLERQAMLETAKKEIAESAGTAQRELQQKQAEDFEKLRAKEQAALLEAFPTWKDPKVAEAEWAKAAEALTQVGFTEAEIGQVMDHRAYRLAMLAAKGLEASKKTDVAKKRVLKIGKKVLKPGASQSKADAKDDAYRTQRAKLRKSGNPRDAVELIKGLL